MARLGADLGEQAHQIVAAPDRQRLDLGACEQIVEVLVVLGGVVGGFADHGGLRRSAKPVFGMIGGLHEARLTVAGRRALGIGEDLGSLGHQPADVFWLELDPV